MARTQILVTIEHSDIFDSDEFITNIREHLEAETEAEIWGNTPVPQVREVEVSEGGLDGYEVIKTRDGVR